MTSHLALLDTVRQLADLAEIRGDARDARDLRSAADAIDALEPEAAGHIIHLASRNRVSEVLTLSPDVQRRLRDLVRGGAATALRSARAGTPSLIQRLLDLSAVSTSEAVALVRELGVLTLADLQRALDAGHVARRLGHNSQRRLMTAADTLEIDFRPLTLGRACDELDRLLPEIAESCPLVDTLTPAGGVRRFEPVVNGIVVVGRSIDPPAALETICATPGIAEVLHRGSRRAIVMAQQAEIDIQVATPEEYGTVLFHATGSRAHVRSISSRRPHAIACAHEEEIYAQAGLAFVPPEMRHGTGEIESAAAGRLPPLITREHIRGDLHMHSNYSDGRDTIATMIETCRSLGYEYVAITDHSESAAASRTLTRGQISRQREEIERLRERFRGMTILHGVEVDILPDGTLDFSDHILERFDIVLASLHEAARQDGAQLTRRCITALRHPLVNIFTHPANRLVGHRPGYKLDFEEVFAAAAETGTALEVDGAPSHLDLDGDHARAAAAAGAMLTVDSDCHWAQQLERFMRFGIGTARRGWVEPRHVLNTRPIDEVRRFIAAKRTRG